ncbi:hypothetical protein HYH03_001146 [Edaphochlamys debaryana]|uniref:Glucosidase 2 subunit beta n=1 Tax=Edaphochlamys debaryana TaxID=47281 RepID=A0A836C5M1_9CHLO|nr:hypothetical protein HYH03_001146 [Edaphochlamys debaryana]|eukprot:KAG2501356.1 hypothetical protein HYH03_001146 [Edaphochlamys debaryana]
MGALFALVLVGLALAQGHAATIRGMNPDLASHYTGAGGTFACITGGKKIPFERVNDDYCDCADGSDEPGTSACHNGVFYCRNLGHEPRLLASPFVDDGICDCCDGADEAKGKCGNRCLEAGAVHREALKAKIAQYEQALFTKAGYITKAANFKQELQLKAGTIAEDIAKQTEVVAKAKAELDVLEKAESDRIAAEEAKRAADAQAAEAALQAQADAAEAAKAAAEKAAADAAANPELATGADAHQERKLGEEAKPEHEETPEERGRRIASQWTHDPEAAGVPASNVEGEEGEDGEHHHGDYAQDQHHDGEEWHDDDHLDDPLSTDTTGTPLGEARNRAHQAQHDLDRLKKDEENIALFLRGNLNFGPDDMFLAFHDSCFTSHQTRWTYEACFFHKATQREGHQAPVTVGRWYGFSEDYKVAHFTGGDECWNVGPRSFSVQMSCGMENRMSDGEEPATCRYQAKLTTPALCTEAELDGLKEELHKLEEFEKEVREKIAKDEL